MSDTKTCTGCGETKPLDGFSPEKRSSDGRGYKCKDCKKAYFRRRYSENRNKVLASNKVSAVRHREKHRQIREDWKRRNPEKVREAQHKYYLKNRAKVRERAAMWEKMNPEYKQQKNRNYRSKRAGAEGFAIPDQVTARVEYFGGRCWICGDKWEAIDHVKPVSKGGSNWPANLRPICKSCNSQKSARWKGVAGIEVMHRTLSNMRAVISEIELEAQPDTSCELVAA